MARGSRISVNRWVLSLLVVASLAFVVDGAGQLLEDRRVRLRTLVKVDPPPSSVLVEAEGFRLGVTGALVRAAGPDDIVLRAWSPTPAVHVAGERTRPVTLRVENVPSRVQLTAAGPVSEDREGLTRIIRFAPADTRRLGFVDAARGVRFAVLGDTGDDPTFAAALRLAAHKGADFLLHVGDLIYDNKQMPNIEQILATTPVPVFVARGNHDYRNLARIEFMRRLAPPYYWFRLGGATFVVLDNAGNYLPTFWRRSTQYRWLGPTLGLPREGPLFVAMHKPPFDRRPGGEKGLEDEGLAAQLMLDFARAGVDAVLTGHVHDSHVWVKDGIPYVVSGEGFASPQGPQRHRMAWVDVRGWDVRIEHVPIWPAD